MNKKIKAALITLGLIVGVGLLIYLVIIHPIVMDVLLLLILIPGFIALMYDIIFYILKYKN